MVDRLIFDLDDTLLDTGRFYRRQLNRFAQKASDFFGETLNPSDALKAQQKIDQEEITRLGMDKKRFPESLVKTWKYLCNVHGKSIQSADLNECARIGWDVYKQVPSPLRGMRETLNRLYDEYQLILYTMGDPDIQSEKIRHHDLSRWFTEIHIVPMKNRETLRPLVGPRPPDRIGIIGDSLRGEIRPGLELGLRAVHRETESNWKYHQVDIEQPYPVIQELPEVLEIFP